MLNLHRAWLVTSLGLFSLVACIRAEEEREVQAAIPTPLVAASIDSPHIIVLLADDLGIDGFSCPEGSPYMPYLSSICQRGVYFSRAYSEPYCTPTRAGLLTGRYTFRHGANDVVEEAKKLALSEVTIPEILTQAAGGYTSVAFGKWHLADDENGGADNPNLQGFAHYEGTPSQVGLYKYYDYPWFVNGEFVGVQQDYRESHTVDAVLNYFSNAGEGGPLFAYVGFLTPHAPFHRPPDALTHFSLQKEAPRITRTDPPPEGYYTANRRDERLDPYYFAMLEAFDHELGRLVSQLEATTDRPIVFVFAGDNGSANEVSRWPRNGPYRAKSSLYEGGVRVPLLVWSTRDKIAGRGTRDHLVSLVDVFATVLSLAGVKDLSRQPQTIDAVDFSDQLIGPSRPRPEPVYVQGGNERVQQYQYAAISETGLKLIVSEPTEGTDRKPRPYIKGLVEVYNILQDPAEGTDLLASCAFSPSAVFELLDFMKYKRASEAHPKDQGFAHSAYVSFVEQRSSACGLSG
jgi:arylsulfatase A-like enzyme